MTLKIVATMEESRAAKNAPAQRLEGRDELRVIHIFLLCVYHEVNKNREMSPRFFLLAS
jgi:hypothetical protein